MSTKRLFVSIEPPQSVTRFLANLDSKMRGVRWLAPEQMHLTLSFLGNVPGDVEEALKKNLAAIEWKAFFLPLIGVGVFPGKGRPNVIWIGVGRGHPHLFQLHKRVQEAAIGAGLEPDLRPFHPHVTLARGRDVSAESVRPFLRAHAAFDAGMIHVKSFCLQSSALTPLRFHLHSRIGGPLSSMTERARLPLAQASFAFVSFNPDTRQQRLAGIAG